MPSTTFPLSGCDQAQLYIPVRQLYCYRLEGTTAGPDEESAEMIFNRVFVDRARSSLRQLVSLCPPLRGALSKENEEQMMVGDVMDDAVDRHVNFAASVYEGPSSWYLHNVAEIQEGSCQEWPLKAVEQQAPFDSLKPLSASFVFFKNPDPAKDEGLVLGILAAHHRLFDADSTSRLFINWSALSRRPANQDDSTAVPFPMTFDREPFKALEAAHFNAARRLDETHSVAAERFDTLAPEGSGDVDEQHLFRYSNETLNRLRQEYTEVLTREQLKRHSEAGASADDEELGNRIWLSRNDVMVANLWQAAVQAATAVGQGHDVPARSCFIPCNVRGRLAEIPTTYMGNGLALCDVRLEGEGSVNSLPPHQVAGKVHAAVQHLVNSPREMRTSIGRSADVAASRGMPSHPGFIVSSWAQNDLYSVDFGAGSPVFATSMQLPSYRNLAFSTASPHASGIDVCVTLPSNVVKAMKEESSMFVGVDMGRTDATLA